MPRYVSVSGQWHRVAGEGSTAAGLGGWRLLCTGGVVAAALFGTAEEVPEGDAECPLCKAGVARRPAR